MTANAPSPAKAAGQPDDPMQAFRWQPQPAAERLLSDLLTRFAGQSPLYERMRRRFLVEAGVRFRDSIACIVTEHSEQLCAQLEAADFLPDWSDPSLQDIGYVHRGAIYPRVQFWDGPGMSLMVQVERIEDFLSAWPDLDVPIEGVPRERFRCAVVESLPERWLSVIERHGHRDVMPKIEPPFHAANRHFEAFHARPRGPTDEAAFQQAGELIDRAIGDLRVDYACDLFFAAEREFWQRRNRAAQIQKARQDRLGIGWANHDHHTYRSSRRHFARLISIFEKLGFHCRERFYAGRQAGWGAQVLEQPNAGVVIFADVDLSPDELMIDFAHEPLPERAQLGTVGLWCALHGESFLEAGMHHLECQFDFDALRQQLEAEAGIRTMKPFTDFPYLRQAFTEGERWPVREERIARLLAAGQITAAQAAQFREQGAIGSHLENLERNQGFKGFNQQGVSEIIAATDPRRHLASDGGRA